MTILIGNPESGVHSHCLGLTWLFHVPPHDFAVVDFCHSFLIHEMRVIMGSGLEWRVGERMHVQHGIWHLLCPQEADSTDRVRAVSS